MNPGLFSCRFRVPLPPAPGYRVTGASARQKGSRRMRSGDGEKPGPLLGGQAAYYRAMAEDYYDHYMDLPAARN